MISVIVPVYKVEKYLKKCIDSILAQTYTDFELILVDDGSPDNSGDICNEYERKDSRVKVIHQKNAGQSSARNIGLANASGEYIAFVDSDDSIESCMFEVLIEAMLKDNADIAICGHRIVREDENDNNNSSLIRNLSQSLDVEELWQEIFGKLNNAVWNKLYKKELLEGVCFPTDLYHGEDLLFNLIYLSKCRSGTINRTSCYNYLKREGSVTTSNFSERKLMEIESKDRALEIVSKYRKSQILNAQKYCFRARMNVMRAIIKVGKEDMYSQVIKECREYTKKNYTKIKKELRFKEKVEWHLSNKFLELYKGIVRKVW